VGKQEGSTIVYDSEQEQWGLATESYAESTFDPYKTGSATARPYDWEGYIATSWVEQTYRSVSIVRDEIYFETMDGSSGFIELEYDVSFLLETDAGHFIPYEETEALPVWARFAFFLGTYDEANNYTLRDDTNFTLEDYDGDDYYEFVKRVSGQPELLLDEDIPLSEPEDGYSFVVTDETITLSTGDAVTSGTYLPMSISAVGYAQNASVNWGEGTVTLKRAIVRNQVGEVLDSDQYLLTSDEEAFPSNYPDEPGIVCDINGDGWHTWKDRAQFRQGCRRGDATWTCDLYEDGRFNWRDSLEYWRQCRNQ
jgi:hypothetical protein